MPMRLAALLAAFEIIETSKGYFLHTFNVTENQQYVGPYPFAEYYGADYMSPEDRANFLNGTRARKSLVSILKPKCPNTAEVR